MSMIYIILIAVAFCFASVMLSHIAGYNHGYKDASMKYFYRAMEKDRNIKELCEKVGRLEHKILEAKK